MRRRHRPAPRPGKSPPPAEEIKVSGARAVRALFARDPDAILRLYLGRVMARETGDLCRRLAQRHRAYAVKEDRELAKIAGTLHHGGIVAVVGERVPQVPGRGEIDRWADARLPVLVMDGVSNPHNFGAIVRTAAFLGIDTLVLSERAEQALPSPAAYRVAEGGMEFVELWRPPLLAAFLRDLARRYRIVGAAANGKPLASFNRGDRPIALVLGNEETGLSPPVAKACAEFVAIPGGRVESLNVSVAAGILIHALLAPTR